MTLLNPRSCGVTDALRRHPRVANQCFYVLPLQLCESHFNIVGNDRLDPADIELEIELARTAERQGGCVGFRNGLPIVDDLLRPTPLNSQFHDYISQNRTTHEAEALRKVIESRLLRVQNALCGYLGWLFTCPLFLEELAELMRVCPEIASSASLPPQPIAFPSGNGSVPSPFRRDTTDDPSVQAIRRCCQRWRLQSIMAPRTMQPLGVQFPVMLPTLQAAQAEQSGALLYIPDIAPLPDRDELREMLEDSVRTTAYTAPHLSEWIELVRADTQGKKSIEKYARWYVVQHYMRVFYSRHGDRLHRCGQKVAAALAQGLNIPSEALRRDLLAIRQRLGPNWFLR